MWNVLQINTGSVFKTLRSSSTSNREHTNALPKPLPHSYKEEIRELHRKSRSAYELQVL